jgi:CRP/FNR family transcriptional regulator
MLDVSTPLVSGNPLINDLFLNPSLMAKRNSVAAGTVLFEPRDPARAVYFIHRGQVRVFQMGPDESGRLLEILGPGEWFGTAALAQASSHGVRTVATSASVVSEIPVDQVLALLLQQPKAAVELMRQVAMKLRASQEEAARLVFDDCNQRLLKTLVRFSRSAAATPQPNGVVLHITHQQLAQAVGVARETVSLALTQLRQQNLLRTGRNQLTFNPDALRQFLQQQRDPIEERVA